MSQLLFAISHLSLEIDLNFEFCHLSFSSFVCVSYLRAIEVDFLWGLEEFAEIHSLNLEGLKIIPKSEIIDSPKSSLMWS
jgi:hypothetical protein